VLAKTAPWNVAARQVMNPDVITVRDHMGILTTFDLLRLLIEE